MQYELSNEFGPSRPRSADSRRPNAPAFSMGHDAKGKLRGSTALDAPGPGAYTAPQGIGEQAVSTRPSSARVKFGTSTRDAMKPSDTPGPASYGADGMCIYLCGIRLMILWHECA